MSFFDKLFEPVEENSTPKVKGGPREELITDELIPNQNEAAIASGNAAGGPVSESGAKEIIKNAFASLEGKATTIYTLRELVSTLPAGTGKEQILGVLSVTKVSVDEIKEDAETRIEILESKEGQMQQKIADEIARLEAKIKSAEETIQESRKNKADAEALLREFKSEKSAVITEIKNIISTIE